MIAISVWGIMATVGAAIGPILGGVLVELLSWQFAFFNQCTYCISNYCFWYSLDS
ncbi:hypothetical protein [Rickettsia africae]|uniref:hypothetical protein n=1 Tax=Rickettsia africae TaxID=35788 RepID=UPI000169CB52